MDLKASKASAVRLGWLICSIASVFYAYEYLLRITPGVMTIELMQFYGIGAASLGHMVAYYYYAYTPMQFAVGLLLDRYSPKWLLTFACLVCATGGLLFSGVSEQLAVAKAARLMMGLGSAFAFVGVLKLATIWLPPERFALVSGLATALGMVGAMVGGVGLAVLTDHWDWKWTLVALAFSGFLLTVIMAVGIKKEPQSLMSDTEVMSTQALFRGLLHILSNSQIWMLGIIGGLLFMSLSVFADFWGISYLQKAYLLTRTEAEGAASMVFLGWAIGAPIVGWLSDALRRRVLPLRVGPVVAALAIMLVLYMPNLSKIAVYSLLFIYGAFCASEVVVFALGREKSPSELSGTAIAVTNMLVMLSGALVLPLVGFLLEWVWNGQMYENIPLYSVSDYRKALALLPMGLLLAWVLSWFVTETTLSRAS